MNSYYESMNNLKNKILNNDLIKHLMSDKDVLAIYLGGSRLLNLELSTSDYDIIVVSKNNAILELYGADLEKNEAITIHIQPTYFYDTLKALDCPEESVKPANALCLLQFLYPSVYYFYESEEYKKIRKILTSYFDKICYFCLEKLLEKLGKPQVNLVYLKSDYHYICFEFMLSNYELSKTLFLTPTQKEQLRLIKKTGTIPAQIINSLNNRLFKQYQFYYDDYRKIYKEVLACQKQFT